VTRIRWITVGVAAFAVLLGALFVTVVGKDPAQPHGSMLDRPAPALSLPNVAGGTPVSTAALRSRTVVVNFWNTWCIPCRQEHEALAQFYANHRNDPDFAMIGIVRDDDEATVRDYVARENVRWTIAMDPKGDAAIAYGTTGQPETYVIGPDGVVHAELFGPASVSDLETMYARARGSA
jgi:cytochrome c biogenesis protein CcmG, thiol:disulfide interchange protein DsbE